MGLPSSSKLMFSPNAMMGSIGSTSVNGRCPVSYHSRSPKPSASYTFFPMVLGLAVASIVLVLSCTLMEETHHVVGHEVMEALGVGGYGGSGSVPCRPVAKEVQ
jgi:hypothetical protein